MNFGQAIEALKEGKKVAREGWNGKGMWLELQVPTESSKMTNLISTWFVLKVQPNSLEIKDKDFELVPWLASQADILSEDWVIVE